MEPGHAGALPAHVEVGDPRLVDLEFDTVLDTLLRHESSQAPATDNRPGPSRVSLVSDSGGACDMEDQSRTVAIVKAILTVVLVTVVVATVLGGATYVVSRALVGMLS